MTTKEAILENRIRVLKMAFRMLAQLLLYPEADNGKHAGLIMAIESVMVCWDLEDSDEQVREKTIGVDELPF